MTIRLYPLLGQRYNQMVATTHAHPAPGPDSVQCPWHTLPPDCPGDPYQRQIERSIALISQQGGWHCPSPLVPKQSGQSQMARPATQAVLENWDRKVGQSCGVPISFVAENSRRYMSKTCC